MVCAIGVLLAVLGCAVPMAVAQQATAPTPAPAQTAAALLKVFVDCNRCDDVYIRQNVEFVEYVRDRAVADVHVLVTTEDTGGGGLSWTAKFIGLGRLAGQERTLSFTTLTTATDDDRRKEFVRVFKLGLVAYLGDTPALANLDVTWTRPDTAAAAQRDPWNYWVFRVSANGFSNGERSSKSLNSFVSVNGNRTTDNWKIETSANANLRTNRFIVDDETIESETSGWNTNALVVKSLGPQWSAGGRASLSRSSFNNIDRALGASAGLEYNFFPYKESSRRSLTIQYTAGFERNNYTELTIYDKLSETVPKHYVRASIGLRQPWGSLSVASQFSQQIDRPSFYRETIFGDTDVRLFKGFSFNIFAQYEKIADQLSLKKDAVSENDVLLRVQQLETSYGYFISFGISYSFGSIFNTIVNPRFGF
jgi:hypothetical protein